MIEKTEKEQRNTSVQNNHESLKPEISQLPQKNNIEI